MFFTKNHRLPFIFSFFNDFLFYYSFYISCFTKQGFSGGSLALLLIIMNASKMLADIPVGIISDVISRRNILLLGLLSRCIFCLLCLFGSSFIVFAIAMAVVGVGNSCLWTHTWNYFYDFLKEKKEEVKFSRFMGKFYAISNIAIAFAGFTGSYVYKYIGFNGVFAGSVFSLTIAIGVILKLPNYKPKTTIRTAKNIKISSPIKFFSLLKAIVKKPRIVRMLILTILMDSMFIVFLDMNTTIMNNAGMSAENISKIVGFVAFVRIFSNYFSGYTEKFISFKRIHSWLLLLMVFSCIASCYNSSWMIIVVSSYLCIYPFFDTSVKTKIEHRIDSNTRATIMSLASLFVSILTIIFNSIIGIVAEQSGYFSAPICIFMIVIITLFFVRNLTQCYRVDLNIRKIISRIKR